MNIQKRGNSYRVRETRRGTTYSYTFDHKPTRSEALRIFDTLEKNKQPRHISLAWACEEYLNIKSNILSPSTLNNYKNITNHLKQHYSKLMSTNISKIDKVVLQRFVNDYSANCSPRTIHNIYHFIKKVLDTFIDDFHAKVALPQKIRKEVYIPTDHDIKVLLQCSKGTKYEIFIKLALFGLRRSEVLALTLDDISDGLVYVNKAKVKSTDGYVVKTTKTTMSSRYVKVSKALTDQIKAQGYIYNGDPNGVLKFMKKVQKENGLPQFSLHKLRHYFCSIYTFLQINPQYIMEQGGWASDYVMKSVYTHALKDKDNTKVGVDYISQLDSS